MASSPSDNIFQSHFHLFYFFLFQLIFQSFLIPNSNVNKNSRYKGKPQCTHYTRGPIIVQQSNRVIIDCNNDTSNRYFFQIFKLHYFQDVTVTWFEADGKTIKEKIRVTGWSPTPEADQLKEDPQTQNSAKGK